jgi:hypothetical protein
VHKCYYKWYHNFEDQGEEASNPPARDTNGQFATPRKTIGFVIMIPPIVKNIFEGIAMAVREDGALDERIFRVRLAQVNSTTRTCIAQGYPKPTSKNWRHVEEGMGGEATHEMCWERRCGCLSLAGMKQS